MSFNKLLFFLCADNIALNIQVRITWVECLYMGMSAVLGEGAHPVTPGNENQLPLEVLSSALGHTCNTKIRRTEVAA